MYRARTASMLVFALLWIEIGPAVASAKTEYRHTRTAQVAALLDLNGAQKSLGRPAMNGFVLGLQQGSENGPMLFTALIDTKSDPEATESAARSVVSNLSLAAGFTDNDSVLTAGPFFQRARVPFLSIGATDPSLPEVVGDSVFLTPSFRTWSHHQSWITHLRFFQNEEEERGSRATAENLQLAPDESFPHLVLKRLDDFCILCEEECSCLTQRSGA